MENNQMRWIKYACLVLLLLVPAELTAKPPDFTELEKLVPEELKKRNTPGAVIAIVIGDRVVYQKAFGVANIETRAPMQPEMLFRLGSTTKMFTAAALVSLAEQNKINLNEPVGKRVMGLDARIGAREMCRRRECVICLQLHHRPYGDAHGRNRLLERGADADTAA